MGRGGRRTYSKVLVKAKGHPILVRRAHRRDRALLARTPVPALIVQHHRRPIIREARRAHAYAPAERQRAVRIQHELQPVRLHAVRRDRRGELHTLRHAVQHLLHEPRARVPELGLVHERAHGDVLIRAEDARVRARRGRADDERARALVVQVLRDDGVVERVERLVELRERVLRAGASDLREVLLVHAAQCMSTGRNRDHLSRVEPRALECRRERRYIVLRLRHTALARLGGIDAPRAEGDERPATRTHGDVRAQRDHVREPRARAVKTHEERKGAVERRARVLRGAPQLELDASVHPAGPRGGVEGREVVERRADPLGGGAPPVPVGREGAGGDGVHEPEAEVALLEVEEVFERIDGRVRPGGVRERGEGAQGEGEEGEGGREHRAGRCWDRVGRRVRRRGN